MKIQSIQSYSSTQHKNKSRSNYLSSPIASLSSKKFHNPSFGSFAGVHALRGFDPASSSWSASRLRILKRSWSEMESLAEYFHDKSDSDIEFITREAHKWSSNNAKMAAARLIEAVKPIRVKKLKMAEEAEALETSKGAGLGNVVEQADRVNRQFLSLLEAEKEGKNPPITNGILVYGASAEKGKFVDDLVKKAGVIVKRFKYDSANPMRTIEDIVKTAEQAETTFQYSKARTILFIEDLDKMLTNKDNVAGIATIGRFKGFVEHMSRDYHTTIVMKTDKPLEEFEEASIAPHRFGIQVELKDGISRTELKRLEELNAEINRLDEKAKEAESLFKSC